MTAIAVLGAAGSVGGKVLAEAKSRGIGVTAVVRDPSKLANAEGLTVETADANDPEAVAKAVAGADAVVVLVKWAGVDIQKLLEGLRRSGVKRSVVVLGSGVMLAPDGRRNYIGKAERAGQPVPANVPAMTVLNALEAAQDLDWTVAACADGLGLPGERTGKFRLGDGHIILDENGLSRISEADFAIAILDEIAQPRHIRGMFSIGY